MRIRLSRNVYLDLESAMEYYAREAGNLIAKEFYEEFKRCRKRIADHPTSFPVVRDSVRRVNFHRFPYHILYQMIDEEFAKILVVKHDHRDPVFGTDRT